MKTNKASKEFVVGKNDIAYVGSQFKENLYDLEVTESIVDTFHTKTLPRYMNDKEILAKFSPTPVTLGDVRKFLKTADRSKWYVFYIEGTDWALLAVWHVGGWHLEASPVTDPVGWLAGDVVVSAREFLSPSEKSLSISDTLSLESRVEKLEAFYARAVELIPSLEGMETQ